jgi:UDP-N-acetylglucosamine transferase subunit ALG13
LIFVTVGAQMPFDRMVRAVDEWAAHAGRGDVLAQIGDTDFRPRHMEAVASLPPSELRRVVSEAIAVVAHAGAGTIITALELKTAILVFPRLASLGETRHDHQVATARYFSESGYVRAAYSEEELTRQLGTVETWSPAPGIGASASSTLVERVRDFALG